MNASIDVSCFLFEFLSPYLNVTLYSAFGFVLTLSVNMIALLSRVNLSAPEATVKSFSFSFLINYSVDCALPSFERVKPNPLVNTVDLLYKVLSVNDSLKISLYILKTF